MDYILDHYNCLLNVFKKVDMYIFWPQTFNYCYDTKGYLPSILHELNFQYLAFREDPRTYCMNGSATGKERKNNQSWIVITAPYLRKCYTPYIRKAYLGWTFTFQPTPQPSSYLNYRSPWPHLYLLLDRNFTTYTLPIEDTFPYLPFMPSRGITIALIAGGGLGYGNKYSNYSSSNDSYKERQQSYYNKSYYGYGWKQWQHANSSYGTWPLRQLQRQIRIQLRIWQQQQQQQQQQIRLRMRMRIQWTAAATATTTTDDTAADTDMATTATTNGQQQT